MPTNGFRSLDLIKKNNFFWYPVKAVYLAFMSDKIKSIRSYSERMVSWLPMPFWVSWLLFWLVIFAVDFFVLKGSQSLHNPLTELGIALFFASISISLGLCARVMTNLYQSLLLFIEDDQSEFEQWYYGRLKWAYTGFFPILFGVLFAGGVELTIGASVNSFNLINEWVLYFRTVYRLLGFFLLGVSIWSLINVLIFPSQLVRFKFKMRLSNLSGIGLQSLGEAFLKMSLLIIGCFTVLVCAILVSPLSGNYVVLIWVGIGSALIFCFFLLPHVGIHRIMAVEKRQQLVFFSNHLEEAMVKSRTEPSLENMQKLRELFELQKHLKDMNDWPFNVSALWQIISALFIPLLLVLLEIILKV